MTNNCRGWSPKIGEDKKKQTPTQKKNRRRKRKTGGPYVLGPAVQRRTGKTPWGTNEKGGTGGTLLPRGENEFLGIEKINPFIEDHV